MGFITWLSNFDRTIYWMVLFSYQYNSSETRDTGTLWHHKQSWDHMKGACRCSTAYKGSQGRLLMLLQLLLAMMMLGIFPFLLLTIVLPSIVPFLFLGRFFGPKRPWTNCTLFALLFFFVTSFPLSRHERSVLAHVFIGHTRLTHCFLLAWEPHPACPSCACPLTVHHLLVSCPLYAAARSTAFGHYFSIQEPLLGRSVGGCWSSPFACSAFLFEDLQSFLQNFNWLKKTDNLFTDFSFCSIAFVPFRLHSFVLQ